MTAAMRQLPTFGPRHAYDFDASRSRPVVRVYPAIPWQGTPMQWVRDDGVDEDLPTVGLFTRGVKHSLGDPAVRGQGHGVDPTKFGWTCNLCNIEHYLRAKVAQREPLER